MFINEGPAHILFCRVERVNFGNLWDKRILKFNGMVKGSMRGKNIVSLFKENIFKGCTEFGNRDFLWFVSLGQLG